MPESKCNFCETVLVGNTNEELMLKEKEHYDNSLSEHRTAWGAITKSHSCSTFNIVGEDYLVRVFARGRWYEYKYGDEVARGIVTEIS